MDTIYFLEGLIFMNVMAIGGVLFFRKFKRFGDALENTLEIINDELDMIPKSREMITIICIFLLVISLWVLYITISNPCAIGWPIRNTIPDYCLAPTFSNFMDRNLSLITTIKP